MKEWIIDILFFIAIGIVAILFMLGFVIIPGIIIGSTL
jgi:hypothetical protein